MILMIATKSSLSFWYIMRYMRMFVSICRYDKFHFEKSTHKTRLNWKWKWRQIQYFLSFHAHSLPPSPQSMSFFSSLIQMQPNGSIMNKEHVYSKRKERKQLKMNLSQKVDKYSSRLPYGYSRRGIYSVNEREESKR